MDHLSCCFLCSCCFTLDSCFKYPQLQLTPTPLSRSLGMPSRLHEAEKVVFSDVKGKLDHTLLAWMDDFGS